MTDTQYERIGIQPQRANRNIDFNLSEETMEYNRRLSEKLSIPMNRVFEDYPETY